MTDRGSPLLRKVNRHVREEARVCPRDTSSMIAAVANTDRGRIEVDGIEARTGLDRAVSRASAQEECGWTLHSCVVARNDRGRSSCRRKVV